MVVPDSSRVLKTRGRLVLLCGAFVVAKALRGRVSLKGKTAEMQEVAVVRRCVGR